VDFVERMIRAGADAVAIHARRVGHESTVAADWKTLEEVLGVLRKNYPDFNFLVNGDFYDRKERAEFIERTKVDGVLLGRPALYNTSIFLPLSTTTSSTVTTIPLVEKTAVVQEYLRHSVRYVSHHKNTKYVVCEMMSHRRTPTGRVPYLSIRFPQGQTIKKTCDCHDMATLCQVWNVDYLEAIALSAISANNISECTTKNTSARMMTLAAGEHRYEDSYFLNKEGTTATDRYSAVGIEEKKTGDTNLAAQTRTNIKRNNSDKNDDQNDDDDYTDNNGQKLVKRRKTLPEEANQPSNMT